MLRAVGMTDDDWDKPQVGGGVVVERGHAVQPAARPAGQAGQGGRARRPAASRIEFTTIAVSDGISMGHEGMRASLVSREVIADSVETVMHAERSTPWSRFAGCDKSLPGMLMAVGPAQPAVGVRLRRVDPAGPPQRRGPRHRERVRGGRRPRHRARSPTSELGEIERQACPTEGSCAGMFTANTMASIGEALGMSLPGSASPPAVDRRRDDIAYESGRAVVHLLELGHPAPPDHDQGGVRERHRRDHGPGRLDQRRAAPAGHRLRGPGRARARRLQPDRRAGAAHRRHQAARQVPHDRPRPHRRRAGRHAASCSTPGCSTATA